ncbi:hypothetical protein PHMEG_00021082 [Phytophthora megakarya]|uniref:Uncharacterized protein n=1 Tax=Phytophthora megakarya TaxID=4795 RepID=A0A225VP20_9STRA|nr:hypothetical protein PHMEG_00021082 [Phytophthora megakarya]
MSTSPSLYPTPSTPVTRDDYVQLAAEIEEYRRQNAAMVEELARHELFNNSLRYRLKSFPRLDSLCGLQLTQLKHDDCINFVSQTLKCIDDIRLQYANDEEFLNRPEFLGWSQYSNRQGEVVNFIIRKELRNVTPQQLMDRTWQLQTDNDSLRRLGPSHIQTNITMLQKITDDILVIDRKTEDHSHTIENTRPLVLRTIHMLFRVAHDDGTQTMGIKTLDTPIGDRIQHDEEVWWDIFYWIRVAPSNSSKEITTITEFGGTNLCECEEHATTWLKELMFLAIRWEAVVVAPFLLKQ